MDTSSAVSKANAFAAAAESYTDAGQFAQAIEAHFRAAEQFLLATAVASDPESSRTLRMLFANHTNKGKALQRRHSTTNSSTATNGGDKIASNDNSSQPAKAFSATTTATFATTTGPPRTANLSSFTAAAAAATVPEGSNTHISHAVKSAESNSSAAAKRRSGPSPTVSKSSPITNYTRSNPPSPSNSPASNLWSNTFEGTDALSGYGSQLLLAGATNQNPNFSDPSTATPATVPVESLDASVFGRSPASSSASRQQGLKHSPNLAAANQAKATRAPLNATQFMPENIDNSYYLLEDAQGNPISTDSDQPEDATPFDKFWDVVESLVQKISISTSAPLQAMQQQAWNPSSMPMPTSSTGSHSSSGVRGTSIPGRPGYAPSVGSSKGPSPQMFEHLKGFKSPPNHPAMTTISSGSPAHQNQQYQQQQMPHSKLSPSSSIATANMLNSYFVVPSNTFNSSSGVAASYLGGTGANGYDPNHVYPEGVDVRLDEGGGRGGAAVSLDGVDNSEYSRGMGGGPSMNAAGGLSLPRKMRAVGETRNSAAARGKTYEELQLENEQLKQTVDFLAKRVSVLDKAAEENNMLKSSIIQFRQDIQKQAKRFGVPSNAGPHFSHLPPRHNSSESNHGRQLSPTSSSVLNQSQMSLPGEGSKTKHGQGSSILTAEVQDQLSSKVNRLELELNALKEQYDQQEQELAKYKEKWIKAKDSARKKKELKTATGLAASALMLEDSAATAESLGGQGSGGGSGSGRGDLGSIDGSMTFSVYGKDGDGAGSTPSSDTPASPAKENEADPSINPHPLSLETGPDLDAEESEFKIFSPSQGNTPLASAIGFQLPPQEQASLSRPAVVTPQYNSVTPTMVAASLSTSVVVDASAALLSSHLRDPATSRSAPAFTGNLMSASIGVNSTKSSPASGRGGSGTAISIQNVSLLQKGNGSDDSTTPSAPPPDLAESSVSGGSMFYSATFQ